METSRHVNSRSRSSNKLDKFATLSFDHVILWFPKTNSHSGPIYINSSFLSHFDKAEKMEFKERQQIKIREKNGFHDAIIVKLGTYAKIKIAEQTIDRLAEEGYSTETIFERLDNEMSVDLDTRTRTSATYLIDSDSNEGDDEENDENYVPPDDRSTTSKPPLTITSQTMSLERQKEADLFKSYGNVIVEPPLKKAKSASCDLIANAKSGACAPLYSSTPPRKPQDVALAQCMRPSSSFVTFTEPATAAASPLAQGSKLQAPEPKVSDLLLLEARVQTGLLKKIIRLQEEGNELLRQGFGFNDEVVSKEDQVIAGCDGRPFRLSQLPLPPNLFAREFVLRKFGEQLCETTIIEPHGRSERIAMDVDSVQAIRSVLDHWFGTGYSWKFVRNSLNQMFRDMTNRKKESDDKKKETKK
ncbi:hypothetical protein BOX15_Mlig010160g5 [Macrostomum lignano]|uniref:BEN domain-containing protein n=1 Tax=Macrostomum lignano TaxID=282301 RepID=A0A267DR71_9PLAT|nr:hypothetical protein BOX15_Mlig010160g5 [Macrostomum lignano]